MRSVLVVAVATSGWLLAMAPAVAAGPVTVRVAHFPNITHAQALVGRADGRFEQAMAPDAVVKWKRFNAGPAVVQAFLAGELDLAYIGTGPAIVGFIKSHGEALRVIAGSADGGAALVVRADSGIDRPEAFRGKRISSPQMGNTQDLALRGWLAAHGLEVMQRGGDVRIIPLANPEMFAMFRRGEIDAAWVPEPWPSRLIHEGGGRLFLDEREIWKDLTGGRFATTLLVAHPRFLAEHPDLVSRWVAVHAEVTRWILANPEEAKQVVNEELERQMGKRLRDAVLHEAWGRVAFTTDPIPLSIERMAQWAYAQGFLGRRAPDLSQIVDGRWLAEATVVSREGTRP